MWHHFQASGSHWCSSHSCIRKMFNLLFRMCQIAPFCTFFFQNFRLHPDFDLRLSPHFWPCDIKPGLTKSLTSWRRAPAPYSVNPRYLSNFQSSTGKFHPIPNPTVPLDSPSLIWPKGRRKVNKPRARSLGGPQFCMEDNFLSNRKSPTFRPAAKNKDIFRIFRLSHGLRKEKKMKKGLLWENKCPLCVCWLAAVFLLPLS